jgi:hypothetical protein
MKRSRWMIENIGIEIYFFNHHAGFIMIDELKL